MSKEKGASGSIPTPKESIELEGGIITAATSTMGPADYSEGYPEPKADGWSRLRMKNQKQ